MAGDGGGEGRAWGGDLIVIVGPGVRHLNDFALPGEGIIEYFFTQHQILISYFFRRGCTRLLLYYNTKKQRSFSFFGRIPVVLENSRSSRGGGGVPPLHPPPGSAADTVYKHSKHNT